MFACKYLYYLQLSGYNIFSIIKCFWYGFIKQKMLYFLFVFYSVLSLCLALFFQVNLYLVFTSFQCLLTLMFLNEFKLIKKVKFTKRMIRLFSCFLILYFVISTLIFSLVVSSNFIHFLYLILLLALPFVLIISLVILMPLEKLIANYFINKAKFNLGKSDLFKIGITGSFGKTSVKEILVAILKEKYNILYTKNSFNTPLGVAKTVNENFSNLNELFVCEMGAKKVGDINYLCKMIDVNCGIVTSVGRQHMQYFKSIDNVYNTKKELPDYVKNGFCVFNLMDKYVTKMFNDFRGERIGVYLSLQSNLKHIRCIKSRILCYSSLKLKGVFYFYPRTNCFSARRIEVSSAGTSFNVYCGNEFLFECSCKLIGIHNIINILLAVAMAIKLGVSVDTIRMSLKKIDKIAARTEIYNLDSGGIVINNGYNSNIDSAKFSLMTLSLYKSRRKIVVTPGLIETDNDYLYNKKFAILVAKYADEVVVVKNKNKKAICDGLVDAKFNMENVSYASSFSEIKNKIYSLDDNYVCLIENDLPDNFD